MQGDSLYKRSQTKNTPEIPTLSNYSNTWYKFKFTGVQNGVKLKPLNKVCPYFSSHNNANANFNYTLVAMVAV